MNTTKLTLVVFSTAAMFYASFCTGQSNVVYYGVNPNALDVVFADTNLSQKARSAIVTDLRVCLLEWGKGSELRLRDKGESAGYLYNWKQCPHYPEAIKFPSDIVSNGASGVALQIPKELSDAYTNAFKFAAANSNAVAAAYKFVAFVSSTNFPNIPPNTLPDYVLEKKLTADEVIANAQDTMSALHSFSFAPPSVLGFRYSDKGPAASNLWMNVPCASPPFDGGKKEWECFPAVWHEGKWKFTFWDLFDTEPMEEEP